MQNVHVRKVPPHAQTIHRSGQSASGGTLYNVPAGKTLVILAVWMCVVSSASAGTGQLTAPSEDTGSAMDLLILKTPAAANLYATNSVPVEIRVPGGSSVSAAGTNLTAFTYGFSGYLE